MGIFSRWLLTTRWSLGSVALLLALFYLVFGLYITAILVKSRAWPSVVGTITSSQVVDIPRAKGVTHSPRIWYRYSVGGTSYDGARIGLFGSGAMKTDDVVSRFPAGASVPVFYDPSAPARAVLVRGLNRLQLLILGALLAFIVVGLLIFPGWKLLRRPKVAA